MPGLTRHFQPGITLKSSTLTQQFAGRVVCVPAAAITNTQLFGKVNATVVAFVDSAHFSL